MKKTNLPPKNNDLIQKKHYPKNLILAGLVCMTLSPFQFAMGHGAPESAVEKYRARLSSDIQNVELREKYIHVLQETQHYDEALSQINILRIQTPDNLKLDFEDAFTYFEKGDFKKADIFISRFLKNHPKNVRGLMLSGRSKLETGDFNGATVDLSKAIDIKPRPDLFLYRSDAHAAKGDLKTAIKSLEDGIARMGNLPVFMTKIINYQKQLGLYPEAIKTIDKIIATLGPEARTEHFITQKADILKQSGEIKASKEFYQQAYTQLKNRSIRVQNLASSKDLNSKLQANLPQQHVQQK